MDIWTITIFIVAAALVLVAEGAGHLLMGRWQLDDARHDADRRRGHPYALAILLVPALVLVLSPAALAAVSCWNGAGPALARLRASGLERAWYAFWWTMLGVDMAECLARLFFQWRRRPFPVPKLLRDILHFLVVAGVLMVVSRYVMGKDISTALASTAVVTAVVGFALQGVLGNLLAGMSIHLVRTAAPGDWIAVGADTEGEVVSTNWRETRLRTTNGYALVVPNSVIASSVIHNMSYPDRVRAVPVLVGASYDNAPGDVMAALVRAADGVPGVLKTPPPKALLVSYCDYAINYKLFFYTDAFERRVTTASAVQSRIWYEFKRCGIEIPFPMGDTVLNDAIQAVSREIHRKPDAEAVDALIADLMRSDAMGDLLADADGKALVSEAELRTVAARLRRVRYTSGEVLFRQGDEGESAYVVVTGALTGRITDGATGRTVAEFALGPGAFAGEMCLITGAPRTATVTSPGECELIEVPKAAFVRLLALRPDIPERLADLVEKRRRENAARRQEFEKEPPARAAERRRSLLERFGAMLRFARRA